MPGHGPTISGVACRRVALRCVLLLLTIVSPPTVGRVLARTTEPAIGVPGGPCRSPRYPTSLLIGRTRDGAPADTQNAAPFFRLIPHRPVVDQLYSIACNSYPLPLHPTAGSCSAYPGVFYNLGFRHGSHILLRLSISASGCGRLYRHDGREFDEGPNYQAIFCDIATALYIHEADLFPVVPGSHDRPALPYQQCDRHHTIASGNPIPSGIGPS